MVEGKGTEMFMHLGQAMEMRHPFSPWLSLLFLRCTAKGCLPDCQMTL